MKKAISYAAFVLALVMIVCAVWFAAGASGGVRSIFGYSLMYVQSGSMEPDIPKNALIVVRRVPPGEIAVGDDITFILNENQTATHRVVSIDENYGGSGARAFETKGVANTTADGFVPFEDVVGKRIFTFDTAAFAAVIKRNWVYIAVIAVLSGALIVVLKRLKFVK
jgi:signal peptidase